MSSVSNGKATDRMKVFETVLSSPGMTETCKVALSPSRQTILVLCRIIEQNLEAKGGAGEDEFLSFLPAESLNELKQISEELLRRGGLVDFYQRLKAL